MTAAWSLYCPPTPTPVCHLGQQFLAGKPSSVPAVAACLCLLSSPLWWLCHNLGHLRRTHAFSAAPQGRGLASRLLVAPSLPCCVVTAAPPGRAWRLQLA